MTDSQATVVVTFDFKGTGVRCIHVESTDINVKRT